MGSNDKLAATFHEGEYQTLPRRVPMETLATWDRTAPPPVPVPLDAEAAYLGPGRPPWVAEESPTELTPWWVWAIIVLLLLDGVFLAAVMLIDT